MNLFLLKLFFLMIPAKLMAFRHCDKLKFSNHILKEGVINVAYLSEPSCTNCTAQIALLSKLSDLLSDTGLGINVILSGVGNFENVPKGFTLDGGRLWKKFKRANGHVIVFDVCGRFTYEVILPFAKLENPFVRAAILSAFMDRPCGGCRNVPVENHFQLQSEELMQENEKIPIFPPRHKKHKLPEIVKESDDGTVPLRIIFHADHKHTDDIKIYRTFEVVTGDTEYHGHISSEEISSEIDTQENIEENIIQRGMGSATITTSNFPQISNNSGLNEKTEQTINKSLQLTDDFETENLNTLNQESISSAPVKQNGLGVDGNLFNSDETNLSTGYSAEQELKNAPESEESQISEEDDNDKLKAHYNNIKKWT